MKNQRFDSLYGFFPAVTVLSGLTLLFIGALQLNYLAIFGVGILAAGLLASQSTTKSTLKPAQPTEPHKPKGRGTPRREFYTIHHHKVHHVH